MRIATLLICLLAFAGLAMAEESGWVFSNDPVNIPEIHEELWCQPPAASWNAFNASTGFNSEMADDIPASLAGSQVTGVVFWHAQWAGGYQAPTGLIVNFYNQACPPSQAAASTENIPYGALQTQMVYQGSWFVNQMTATLTMPFTLGATSSIGGKIDNAWGQNAPYNGLCIVEYPVTGCEGYWDGAYWGMPRWTPFSAYWGSPLDLAYCILGGATPTAETTWGQVRSLYR